MGEIASTAELQLIAAGLAAGRSVPAVAKVVGLSERSVYRRSAMPECQELVAEQRRQAAREILDGVVGGAIVGLQRLIDIAADPDSPAGAAVAASRFLVESALGPGGVGALQKAIDQAERDDEPEPGERVVDEIKARLAVMAESREANERSIRLVEQSRSKPAGPEAPVWSG